MRRVFVVLLIVTIFVGCSLKTKPNLWEYKSAQAFESFKNNFLKGRESLAKSDLKRAVEIAKSSDDLTQLASIYLGKCALELAVGQKDKCEDFHQIQKLVRSKKLDNYYYFLQNDTKRLDPKFLPKRYKGFANVLKKGDYKAANKAIESIEDPVSAMVSLSLLGDKALKKSIKNVLKKVSFYGYKKGVIYLLGRLVKKTIDPQEKEKLQKKIAVLKR